MNENSFFCVCPFSLLSIECVIEITSMSAALVQSLSVCVCVCVCVCRSSDIQRYATENSTSRIIIAVTKEAGLKRWESVLITQSHPKTSYN